jgi:hypothetical protein
MFTQVILIGVNLTETPTYLPLDFTIYKTKGREDKEKKSSLICCRENGAVKL